MKTRTKIASLAAVAIATPLIASWEGLETKPYRDIGGVMTVCYGETSNIENRRYTKAECDDMLSTRVPEYYYSAMQLINDVDAVPITMQAAITSFNYNVGVGAFKKSTMLKKINRGDLKGACEEFDRWVYVSRMYVQGLANRRAAEKKLCVAELK